MKREASLKTAITEREKTGRFYLVRVIRELSAVSTFVPTSERSQR